MKKIYLFAAIFALLAGISTYFFANTLQKSTAEKGVEEANVVIALQDIEPDTVVTPEMFKVESLPVSAITYGTVVNPNEINGYVAAERISKGEQVLATKLIRIGEKTNLREANGEYRLSYHLDDGNYAYTIAVESEDAVAYFIRKGDYINAYSSAVDEPVLQNVKVLEIGSYSDHKLAGTGTETSEYTLLTLSLKEEQIKEFLKFKEEHSADGSYHVVLVPYIEGAQIDDAEFADSGEEGEGEIATPETNQAMGELVSDPDAEGQDE